MFFCKKIRLKGCLSSRGPAFQKNALYHIAFKEDKKYNKFTEKKKIRFLYRRGWIDNGRNFLHHLFVYVLIFCYSLTFWSTSNIWLNDIDANLHNLNTIFSPTKPPHMAFNQLTKRKFKKLNIKKVFCRHHFPISGDPNFFANLYIAKFFPLKR